MTCGSGDRDLHRLDDGVPRGWTACQQSELQFYLQLRVSRVRSFVGQSSAVFNAARLIGRACALSAALSIGHVAGFLLAYWREKASQLRLEEMYGASIRGELDYHDSNNQYSDLFYAARVVGIEDWGSISKFCAFNPLQNFSKYQRYFDPKSLVEDYSWWVKIFVMILPAVAFGFVCARFAPLPLRSGAWPGMSHSAPPELRKEWRRYLVEPRPLRVRWLAFAAAVGFFTAIFGEAISACRVYAIQEAIQHGYTGFGQFALYPHPLIGVWLGTDVAIVLMCCWLFALGGVVVGARRRWADDPSVTLRWCAHCGYPKLSLGSADQWPTTPCSECGRVPRTIARFVRVDLWFRLAIMSILIGSMVIFFGVPRWIA